MQGAGGPGGQMGMAPGGMQGAAMAAQAQQAAVAGLAAANAALLLAQQQQAQAAAAGGGGAVPVPPNAGGAGGAPMAGVILAADIMQFPPGTPLNVQQMALGPDMLVNFARDAVTVTTLHSVTCPTDGGANGGFTALHSQLMMLAGHALYTTDVQLLTMSVALHAVHPTKLGALLERMADSGSFVRGTPLDAAEAQAAVWAGGNLFDQNDPPTESLITVADLLAKQPLQVGMVNQRDIEQTRAVRAVTFGHCAVPCGTNAAGETVYRLDLLPVVAYLFSGDNICTFRDSEHSGPAVAFEILRSSTERRG